MAERAVVVRLRAEVQGFKAAMAEAEAAARRAKTATDQTGQAADTSMGRLVQSATKHKESWDTVGKTALTAGVATLAGVGMAIKQYADFDRAMSEVRASTHETAGNMDLLRTAAVDAGADTSFSAQEAAQAIDELAKAGVSTADILSGGLAGSLSLAAAGSLDVAKAAEISATAMTIFGKTYEDKGKLAVHVADLLAAGAGKAQGSVEDMGMALNQTGLVAAQTGLNIEETTGGLAAFASAGLIGSDAGTSFKTMLQRLTPQSLEAKNKMAELGISAYDAQGNFIGLEKFAGNLRGAMERLTPEARNAAMGVIFGSDAVRAANVLYENGAEGIGSWIDKVNEAGYAAVTASIKQDNLAGDIEKLGGSFDSVLIKGGSGAAQSLRGLVQGAEDLVDMIGNLPAPMLTAATTTAGLAGGALVLGGAFLTLFPRVLETVTALKTMSSGGSKVPGVLGKIGKAAGAAALALAAMQIAAAVFTERNVKSAEDYGQALLKVAKGAGEVDPTGLDSVFQGFDRFAGQDIVTNVDSMAGAVERLTHQTFDDSGNKFFEGFTNLIGLPKGEIGQLEDRLKGLGDEMGNLVRNGAADTAAKSFQALTKEFEKNGKGAQEALDSIPGYRDALKGLANQSGVTLSDQELLDLAMGKIPPSMQSAATATQTYTDASGQSQPVTEETTKKLEELGLTVEGVSSDLDKYAAALVRAGLSSLSQSDAARNYLAAIDEVDAAIAKNGITMDTHTAAGRANEAALLGVASAGLAEVQTMADATDAMGNHIYTSDQLHGKMSTTYDDLIKNAAKFNITGDAADTLARKALGIPKGVNIDAWLKDYASSRIDAVVGKANAANGKSIDLYYNIHETTFISTVRSDSGVSSQLGTRHDGQKIAYANGGGTGIGFTAAATGLRRESMIAPGGANILWAEPETGWEAYISGKPGQENRNRAILQTIAPRFGLEVRARSREFDPRQFSAPSAASPGGAGAGDSAAAMAAAVAGAMSGWQPVVSIGGREFYGLMAETTAKARRQ